MISNMKEISLNEMEKAAWGNILDDFCCALKGHKYSMEVCVLREGNLQYSYFKCKRCGEKKYCKLDHSTGKQTEISRKEFEAVYN